MSIWRVHLKPDSEGKDYRELLEFCKNNEIIGVGWSAVECCVDDYDTLKSEVYRLFPDGAQAALQAVNSMRSLQTGDLIWTRVGGEAFEYYLCRVGNRLWKDREITDIHKRYDICNYVSAKWIRIGKEENVPGKIVNSFCARRTIQRVYDVDDISKVIWNRYSEEDEPKYNNLPVLTKESFWEMIGSEDLECLVFLYLQKIGYYIYSSTLKISTPKFEAVLIHSEKHHLAYPQVKRESPLLVEDYIACLNNEKERIYLFTTSENYGTASHPQIMCIKKNELIEFIKANQEILPPTILFWWQLIVTN